jgi:hypothetical protein
MTAAVMPGDGKDVPGVHDGALPAAPCWQIISILIISLLTIS